MFTIRCYTCPRCHGTGIVPIINVLDWQGTTSGADWATCLLCDGEGMVTEDVYRTEIPKFYTTT